MNTYTREILTTMAIQKEQSPATAEEGHVASRSCMRIAVSILLGTNDSQIIQNQEVTNDITYVGLYLSPSFGHGMFQKNDATAIIRKAVQGGYLRV
jgi:hypothetical protein